MKEYSVQRLQRLAQDEVAFEKECLKVGTFLVAEVGDALACALGAHRDALLVGFGNDKLLEEARQMLKFWVSSAPRPPDVVPDEVCRHLACVRPEREGA